MKKKGLIEIPTIDGKQIKLISQSPLAAAQRMQDVTNMDTFMQRLVGIFGPQITQVMINQNEAVRWYADKQQVPLNLLRSEQEQQELLQQTIGALAPVNEQMRGDQ